MKFHATKDLEIYQKTTLLSKSEFKALVFLTYAQLLIEQLPSMGLEPKTGKDLWAQRYAPLFDEKAVMEETNLVCPDVKKHKESLSPMLEFGVSTIVRELKKLPKTMLETELFNQLEGNLHVDSGTLIYLFRSCSFWCF